MMTNTQAQAYAVLAMKRLGFDRKTVEAVEREMYWLFDNLTEEEAEEKAFGIKIFSRPVCECCGSKNDVAGIFLVESEIDLCQGCRVIWFDKTRFDLHKDNIEGRDRDTLIQLIRKSQGLAENSVQEQLKAGVLEVAASEQHE